MVHHNNYSLIVDGLVKTQNKMHLLNNLTILTVDFTIVIFCQALCHGINTRFAPAIYSHKRFIYQMNILVVDFSYSIICGVD